MKFDIAIIKSSTQNSNNFRKICGLYPLERNILILARYGVKKIYLDITNEELTFYNQTIKRHLKKLSNTEIIENSEKKPRSEYLEIHANLFTQFGYFNNFDEYFQKKGNKIVPVLNNDQFQLEKNSDFTNAKYFVINDIVDNTGSFIAKKINKRISIPISLQIVKTRIHPNILTAFNMLIGIISSVLLLYNNYLNIALGGFLFQLASVIDGVDGEVAKFTFRESKVGGWFDTITDNLTLFLFLSAVSYLCMINYSGLLTLILIIAMFMSLVVMLFIMFNFLRRYSSSESLTAYDKEFLQRLPKNDILVKFILLMKFFIKKEFYAMLFFLITLTGQVYIIVFLTAITIFTGMIILIILQIKYSSKLIKSD